MTNQEIEIVPSPQQDTVIRFPREGRGSVFVEAVAGSGKTTTLIKMVANTTGSVAFAAYNTKIAAEIKLKVGALNLGNRVRVATFHGFGLNAWKYVHKDVRFGKDAAREKDEMSKEYLAGSGCPDRLEGLVFKLVSLAKQRCVGLNSQIDDPAPWWDIIDHFDLAYEIEDEKDLALAVAFAQELLRFHIEVGNEIINFDDMIYLPVVSGIRMWENDWILVDEAQDTNPARRALARKMLRRNGRAVFVGDRHQAIYGFTGADSDAIDQIITDFRCATLPLTVTYRCPKSVVREAQTIVSHIHAADEAPEGSVSRIAVADLMAQKLTVDDAILCRNTRPLVEMAYTLIRGGVPCHVEGRDIGAGLLKLVNRYSARSLPILVDKLTAYMERESAKLIAKGRETQAEALIDRVETVFAIARNCTTIKQLVDTIYEMFVDSENEQKPTLTLATAHRSKGREWGRVFLLYRDQLMPSHYARQEWQIEQENNLIYVAMTRAQDQLVYVEAE